MESELTPVEQPPRAHRSGILLLVWLVCAVGLALVVWEPLGTRVLRAATVLFSAALVLIGFALTPRLRTLRWAILSLFAFALAALALPVRSTDATPLRATYVATLQRYSGTPYLWGGENRRGIDCSGLVRRAMVDALLDEGAWTLDPGLMRRSLWLWWQDRPAVDLDNQADGWCRPLFDAATINAADRARLQPGDLAVVGGGVHVLAYLGDGRWISADPGDQVVLVDQVPNAKAWFRTKAHIVRWTALDQGAAVAASEP